MTDVYYSCDAASLYDLIAACDEALNWADANARWFDISTAPRDGTYILVRVKDDADRYAGRVFVSRISHHDDVSLYPGYASGPEHLSHWRPLPPPPSNPPLPEPLEALGAVLRRVKGENG